MAPVVALFFIWAQLDTIAGTSLKLTQTQTQAFLGQSLQFKCDVTTTSKTGALLFERNTYVKCSVKRDDCTQYTSDSLSQTQYTCGCGQQGDGNYVYFLNASSLHADVVGDWRCEYQMFSNTIRVNLTDSEGPTEMSLDKTEVSTKEGDSVNLTCSANCLPDCRYSWTKGGQDLTSQTREIRGQVLALNRVVGDDSGNYTCTAVNPSSNKASNVSMNLHVLTAPKKKEGASFTPTLRTSKGETARLEVTFSGDPPPEVSLCKIEEGSLTPVNNVVEETVFQATPGRVGGSVTAVFDVKVETDGDLGMYYVSAVNIVDRTVVYFELRGEGDQTLGALCSETDNDGGMRMFGFGACVGACVMLAVGIIIAVVVFRKYHKMKRDLEFPYASTISPLSGMDPSHYQELPSPKDWKKQLQDGGYILPEGDRPEVYSIKTHEKPVEDKAIATKAATNPIYDHISLYGDSTFPRQNSNCSTSSS
ncbi:leucine-rich repeats and immunoglobulin-like domains protein 3 [Haliotis rubra]|uniref:leucine-rich repeats and immunoglobulin-like domains protein 3 n=1 Tax=Haliotis rubra TaxID=36100 RepID=UPI001EE564D1|nr:leucine-rich repeats and immunoglobulin-like domains protein 3 [Haliotis rubra]